jgi:hypothetical protein
MMPKLGAAVAALHELTFKVKESVPMSLVRSIRPQLERLDSSKLRYDVFGNMQEPVSRLMEGRRFEFIVLEE